MTKKEVGNLMGEFSWNYFQSFFIETKEGNFIWNDPEYKGDNSIVKTKMSHKQWLKKEKIPYSRSKGTHYIKDYCGENFTYKE